MPKRALIINGADGGMNKDSDLSDIKSAASQNQPQDRRQEVFEATNIFTDYSGKFVTEYPTAQSSNGVAAYTQGSPSSSWTINTSHVTPIAATTYNVGSDGAHVSAVYTTNGAGVPTFTFVNTGEGLAVGNTFRIVENGSSNYVVITVTAIQSSVTGITEDSSLYDSSAEEIVVYDDKLYRANGVYKWGNFVISSGDVNYMSFIPTEGEIGSNAVDANLKHGVDFWLRPDRRPIEDTAFNYDAASETTETWEGKGSKGSINIFLGHQAPGWNPQGLGDISNFASGVLFDRQAVEKIGSWVAWGYSSNSATAPTFQSGGMGSSSYWEQRRALFNFTGTLMDIRKGLYGGYVAHLESGDSPSVQVVARKAEAAGSGIKFDQSDNGTTTDDAHLLAWDGQYAFSGGTSKADWEDIKLLNDFYFCSVNEEWEWGNASISETDPGRDSDGHNLDGNERAICLLFMPGEFQSTGTTLVPGAYGTYCPSIEGKTMRLHVKFDDGVALEDGSGNPVGRIVNEALDRIRVFAVTATPNGGDGGLGANSLDISWGDITTDTNLDGAQYWDFTRSQILSAMDDKGYAVLERDVGLPTFRNEVDGNQYLGNAYIQCFIICAMKNKSHEAPTGWGNLSALLDSGDIGSIMFKLKEFSFFEESVIGWKEHRYVRLFQTGIKNGIESMLQPYQTGSDIDNDAATPWIKTITESMEAMIRKPHADSIITNGKIYYAACDQKGVTFGEHYLLCEWDLNKGVKWSGSEDESFEAWTNTGTIPLGVGADSQSFYFESPPIASTYTIETGFPVNTTVTNALWKTATTIGKQVYIGNVAQEKPYNAGNFDPADLDTSQTFILPAASGNTGDGLKANPFITGTTAGQDQFTFNNSSSYVQWGTASGDAEWANRGFSVGDSFVITEGLSNTANENVVFEITAISNYQATVSPAPTDATDNNSKTIFAFGAFDKSKILKTSPGMPAGFSDALYMDLEFGGDEIAVLESVGDRLLVFSKYKLSIVNVASDIDFIEGTFDHLGITKARQVCNVGEGVAFVNASGVYLFDGEGILTLSGDKMKSIAWSADTSAIAYDALRDLLWVWISNENIYYYCLEKKTWVGYSSLSDADFYNLPDTNVVAGNSGYSHYAKGTTALKRHMFIGASTNIDAALDRDILLQTGKIDCGDLGSKKIFYDIYVSCLNAGASIKVEWTVNNIDWYVGQVHGYKGQSTNVNHGLYDDLTTRCGLIDDNSDKAKGKWIMFRIVDLSNMAKSSLEIGDISLIYRNKMVK